MPQSKCIEHRCENVAVVRLLGRYATYLYFCEACACRYEAAAAAAGVSVMRVVYPIHEAGK